MRHSVIEHTGHHGSIQRGKKFGYALTMRTDYEETQNLKRYDVKDCPYHANKDMILERINEFKSINKLCQKNPKRTTACRAARIFRNAPRHMN